jgi:hypothetical protein
VERLQGTILSKLWRIESRRRFFTGIAAVQTILDHKWSSTTPAGRIRVAAPEAGHRERSSSPMEASVDRGNGAMLSTRMR